MAVQEYGQSNASLVAGLEARGARVQSVHVYRWELPEDIAPLMDNIKAITAGLIDVSLFTSGHQAVNLLRVAQQNGSLAALRQALAQTVIGSIGPTTSETLREIELPVDFEPEHAKMGHLVQAGAEKSRELLSRKRQAFSATLRDVNQPAPVERPAAPPS